MHQNLFNRFYLCKHFIKIVKSFSKVLIWLSKMLCLILTDYMLFKGTWKQSLEASLETR